ncbi:glycosyltransferase family A protein [uncultured Shewanella sp.]|uniref:glycosyltransferase family A protein n=1 Tax=uncultured Shewanella sp. TaxID=173975 RepID=UPI00262D563C|nr:glycosyltransferase family A protein [uncultured Shewanella sp.]
MDKLVSVVIPCYNSYVFLPRLFDCLLAQSYKKLEIIAVNDGSTDQTNELFDVYKSKFINNNIDFIVIDQGNSGQAVAINQALKVFRGEYITWIDSDDWLENDAIELKYRYLEENSKLGFVRTDVAMYKYPDYENVTGLFSDNRDFKSTNIFMDLILEKNVYFCPGGYLVRTSSLLDVLPGRHIIESRAGQNWQLLLPLAEKYECGYIDKPLFNYLVRDSSHSHSVTDLDEKIKRCQIHKQLILNILSNLNVDYNFYEKILNTKYRNMIISLCYQYGDLDKFRLEFKKLGSKGFKNYLRLIVLLLKVKLGVFR